MQSRFSPDVATLVIRVKQKTNQIPGHLSIFNYGSPWAIASSSGSRRFFVIPAHAGIQNQMVCAQRILVLNSEFSILNCPYSAFIIAISSQSGYLTQSRQSFQILMGRSARFIVSKPRLLKNPGR